MELLTCAGWDDEYSKLLSELWYTLMESQPTEIRIGYFDYRLLLFYGNYILHWELYSRCVVS